MTPFAMSAAFVADFDALVNEGRRCQRLRLVRKHGRIVGRLLAWLRRV
jgi:hypothetical protein